MDFSFTEEQELLRVNLRAFLNDHYNAEARKRRALSAGCFDRQFWRSLASDLGILALAFPERVGGLEADPTTTLVVMEELGRALVIEPYLETVVICGGLLRRTGGIDADAALTRIGSGEQIMALAWSESEAFHDFAAMDTIAKRNDNGWQLRGGKVMVRGAPWASHLLVTARTAAKTHGQSEVSLFYVDINTPGLSINSYATIDGRCAADVIFDNVQVPGNALIGVEGEALTLLDLVADEAIAALSAESLGVTSRMLEDTLSYTKHRRQFGQPLATFQALQHRMADMYMQVEMARSATYLATLQLDEHPRERTLAASAAKVSIAKCCRFVGQNAVQLHGGMGITDELAVGHFFKRATVIEHELGTVDFHLTRFAELSRAAR